MASLSFHKSLHRRTDSRAIAASAPPAMPLPSYSTPATPTTPLAHVVDVFRPRKNRFRATAIALLSLVALSSYIVFFAGPSLSTAPLALRRQPHPDRPSAWQQFAMNYAAKYAGSAVDATEQRQHVVLDPAQELAALTAFMAALPQNVLPTSVDPAQPLDPQLVLDFDTRSPGASDEVVEVVHDAWHRNPVVLFTKSRSSVSRELKAYIDALNLKPAQTVFDVDERDDTSVLIPILYRLTGATELPILLVGGHYVGDMDAVRSLQQSGELKSLVTTAGAMVDGRRRKKGRNH